jgi:hypothetical protein
VWLVILASAASLALLVLSHLSKTVSLEAGPDGRPHTPRLDEIQFTVYRPKFICPGEWYPLLAFAHLADRRPEAPGSEPGPIERVRVQAQQSLGMRAMAFRDTSVDALRAVPSRGEITVVPSVSGIECNPKRWTFRWLEDIHRAEFRLRASGALDGTTARGRLVAYLGAILLAEVDLAIKVDSRYRPADGETGPGLAETAARPFRKIFASYSHRDTEIVRQYEAFMESCGDRYLRDVRDLRSGEQWNLRLLALIDEADIFQLFWSSNSMRSRFVRREWEHALALGRPDFIRPTYWEEPLPESPEDGLPPESLRALHFHRIAVDLVAPRAEPAPSRTVVLVRERHRAPAADRGIATEAPPLRRSGKRKRRSSPAVLGGLAMVLLMAVGVGWLVSNMAHVPAHTKLRYYAEQLSQETRRLELVLHQPGPERKPSESKSLQELLEDMQQLERELQRLQRVRGRLPDLEGPELDRLGLLIGQLRVVLRDVPVALDDLDNLRARMTRFVLELRSLPTPAGGRDNPLEYASPAGKAAGRN